jgi:chloramphenicol 3-O phosphotransferase
LADPAGRSVAAPIHVVVLNGGSSSGKTTLAACLQGVLPGHWLRLSIDALVDACPPSLIGAAGLDFLPNGDVRVGSAFRQIEDAWMEGIAAMAHAGARVIVEDVFLRGSAQQKRWQAALTGLEVLWVGVRCAPGVAAARERGRADRIAGMAASQARAVHRGVVYDLEVDTAESTAGECASQVAGRLVKGRQGACCHGPSDRHIGQRSGGTDRAMP